HLGSYLNRAVEERLCRLLDLPGRIAHRLGRIDGVAAAMILVLGNAFEHAILYADIPGNNAVNFVINLITQAVERRPFRRIDGSTPKVVEENHGTFGRVSVGSAARRRRILSTAEQAPRCEDAR